MSQWIFARGIQRSGYAYHAQEVIASLTGYDFILDALSALEAV